MNFCPKCGSKIQFNQPKYCPNCGLSLVVEKEIDKTAEDSSLKMPPMTQKEDIETEYIQTTKYERGMKFEDIVEDILKAQGYSTQRRLRLQGEKGKSEVDIFAFRKFKGNEKRLAVECKNYENPVPVKDVRDFIAKLEDLSIPNGLFVAYSEFSSDAQSWGENWGLQLWDGGIVKEKFYELKAGRLKTGEKIYFKYCLPLKISLDKAIHIDFDNKEKVEVSSAKLIWRPFYKVFYEVDCAQTDPIGRKHRIRDSGFNIINALPISLAKEQDVTTRISKTVSLGLFGKTTEEKKEEKETKIFKRELEQNPEEDRNFTQPDDYRIIQLSPHMTFSAAKSQTIDYVIEKNTEVIEYEVPSKKRRRDDWDDFDLPETKEWTSKPTPRDVRIRNIQDIYAPKWEIEFQSKEHTYIRIISGNSGAVISDNITHCSLHWMKELIGVKKKNIAVCDLCGKALCKEHIFRCPSCNLWLCERDSIQCKGCKRRFCSEHIKNKCTECGGIICASCSLSCPICNEIHCKDHMTKCAKCGKGVCVSCTRKEGGLVFKKIVCKNCS